MDLTGFAFDTATLQAGALLVLGFLALKYSARAIVQMMRNAQYYKGYDD
ncbi:MAG: hypothetical protein ACYCYR_17020 [Desulfobulbaceae bacterium]